jgi:hypothetical protein
MQSWPLQPPESLMNIAHRLSSLAPAAPIDRRTRIVIALSGVLMLVALLVLVVPMTVVGIAGSLRGAQ